MSEHALYLKAYRAMRDAMHRGPGHIGAGFWECPACGDLRHLKNEGHVREFIAGLNDRELLSLPGIGKRSVTALRAWSERGEGTANWVGEGVAV